MNKLLQYSFRLLSLMLGCLLMAGSLSAQPRPDGSGPPMPPDSSRIAQMVDELAVSLSLTADQKTKVAEFHFAHFKEARQLMEKHSGNRDSHRQAMDALRHEFHEQIRAVLTNEQKTKFEEIVKNRKNRGPRSRQQRPKRR